MRRIASLAALLAAATLAHAEGLPPRIGAFVASTNSSRAQMTALNLSQDLKSLGIASSNMDPNQPTLDAGPLLSSGVAYAMAHGIGLVIADPGTYYFLNLQTTNAHVQLGGNPTTPTVSNLTIDLQGSALVFTHPLQYGIILWQNTNVVLQNFTTDYQPLPFTQLRVAAVDTALAQLQYSVEPGYQDPAAFNSAQPSPGAGPVTIEVHVFRNGRQAFGTRRMEAQFPFSGGRVTIVPGNGFDPTPANMATIRPGDIAVVAMRQFDDAVVAYRCGGCTFRNITVYSGGAAINVTHSDHTVWERVYSIPKPGTDRLISSFGFGLQANGPNNQVRLSRAIRTLDGGFALYTWPTGAVESQPSVRAVTVSGTCCALGQGVTIPNGSPVVFQRRSDGAILASAILVSQTGSVNAYNPDHLSYTFDRDLPGNLGGAVMYTTDINQRGGNSLVERNMVQDKSCCFGMDIWGWAGSTVRGNYIRRVGFAGIGGIQSLVTTTWTTPPLVDMTFSNNVIDGTKMTPDWWLQEMGGIQMVGVGPDVNGNPDLMSATAHQNINITNNFIADPGRAAVWLGNTAGANVSGNLFLHPNERQALASDHPPQTNVIAPLIVDTTSSGITAANNTIDRVSGSLFPTDTQYRELAAYAPGGTVRLNAYGVGGLGSPTLTLTDADGVTRPVTIQTTATHAIDVQLPAAAGLGGAYLTLTSGNTKYFGTLFVDSQDNIPAVNGCVYEASLSSTSVAATAGNVPVLVVTQPGCVYPVLTKDAWVTASATGTNTGIVSVGFATNPGGARTTTIEIAGQPFTITQNAVAAPTPPTPPTPPIMTLDKTSLNFGVVTNGAVFVAQTSMQPVRLTQSGAGTVTWTASSNVPWLVVSPVSGSGTATLNISVQSAAGLTANQVGAITLNLTGAANTAGPISVSLTTIINGTATAPVGSFDTPLDGTTGVAGSIAVTGWALDDVEVTRVRIERDPVAGEPQGATVFIGNASFVDGARPDVGGQFPALPLNTRAGWGYLMLTNFLPNLGNGTFKLYAFADDADGHSTLLGTKTIVCTNAVATTPFGAIDTPGQGATVSGTVNNFGWVLAPGSKKADPLDGGSVRVVIDGAIVGSPEGWVSRPDLTALFAAAQFSGVANALGVYTFDSTTLSNGVHTIAWVVTDNQGESAGIGSRYFTVSNGTGVQPAQMSSAVGLLRDSAGAVMGRRGSDLDTPFSALAPDGEGILSIAAEELDRIEIRVGAVAGSLRTAVNRQPLPIGSRIDPADGTFAWQPGPGFIGQYELVFDTHQGEKTIRVKLYPQGVLSRATVIIDTPAPEQQISGPFTVAGWAVDPTAREGTGIDALYVWAYPRAGHPVFLGATSVFGERPDVADIFGRRALSSGYGVTVQALPPGAYDIAVFAWSSIQKRFLPAVIRPVTVK